jgi:hypothetical protein
VRVATGDLDGDRITDLFFSAGTGGGPHVRALRGLDGTELTSFFAYNLGFTGGIFIAASNTTPATLPILQSPPAPTARSQALSDLLLAAAPSEDDLAPRNRPRRSSIPSDLADLDPLFAHDE